MVKSVLKKSLPFKSYSKNSELPSKKFLIKMSIFVLQRYLSYKYWAMCYEVVLMCYVSRPIFFYPLRYIETLKKGINHKVPDFIMLIGIGKRQTSSFFFLNNKIFNELIQNVNLKKNNQSYRVLHRLARCSMEIFNCISSIGPIHDTRHRIYYTHD
jgi:hypothetical protein